MVWEGTVRLLCFDDKKNRIPGNMKELTTFLNIKGFFWESKEGILLQNLDKILKLRENEEGRCELEYYLNNIENINEKKVFQEEWNDAQKIYLEMEKEDFIDYGMEKMIKIAEEIRKKIVLNLLSSREFRDFLFDQNTKKFLSNKYAKNSCLCGEFSIPTFGLKNEKIAILSDKEKKKFSEEDSMIRNIENLSTCEQSLPNFNMADI